MTQVVRVFIASPGDVQIERDHAWRAIQKVSERTEHLLDIVLVAVTWQGFLPCQSRRCGEPVQDRFNRRVRKCGIFIGILGERYGTEIDESRRVSGTEEEFAGAIRFRNDIEILTYFRKLPDTVCVRRDSADQPVRLEDLKKRLKGEGLLCNEYESPDRFYERVLLDLFEAVLRIRTEAERREQYASFFSFGVGRNQGAPSVVIAYPPIHKHIQQVSSAVAISAGHTVAPPHDWQERFLPNVVYEDVKCIQKIESAVRLTGVEDISAVTIDHPKMFTSLGNRIWLCLPRNDIASRQLTKLGSRSHFSFRRDQQEDRPHIVWKPGRALEVEIRSPMRRYLEAQHRPKRSQWKPDFGTIVARDYAVIGRFTDPDSVGHTDGEPYYHYFVAGIRGLGTWGAGWYIDRRPKELQQLAELAASSGVDPQVLLEVTYSSFRIMSVEDVSARGQDYFDDQQSPKTIESVIDAFRL